MKVEVLYFEGCPNHAPTVTRVREELQAEGLAETIREIEVRTPAEAEALGFLGSPSVRINGLDIEPEARNLKTYGMSCRTYMEGTARTGMPPLHLIRGALDEQRRDASGSVSLQSHGSCCETGSASTVTPHANRSGALDAQTGGPSSPALFAGGLAAVLASTCCLGPLLLVTLGISGAWIGNLTRLEPYRPFFIAIAVGALFFAWRSIYRPAPACKPGEACALPQTGRLYKLLFWASSALTLLALTYPYFAKYFY